MLKTPLYNAHLSAGAKMTEFAGWDMPIHYGSQLEEHHQVRNDAGMFDVSHMRAIDVTGADAQPYLRHLLANDVAKLETTGKALYSCLLRDDGGILDDLIVYFFSAQNYRFVVNAGTAEKDWAWMQQQAAGFDVTLRAQYDVVMIALQGPQAREKFHTCFPAAAAVCSSLLNFQAVPWNDWLIARTGYTGEDGYEITLPATAAMSTWAQLTAAGIAPCGLGARDTLRLEAGMNLYGQDMDETQNPLESGLTWTLDHHDPSRQYIGRSALDSMQPARHLSGLLLLDKGVLRAHQKIITAHGDGETTSGGFAPTLNRSIALARLPLAIKNGDAVHVEIRGKLHNAMVVKPPFVRHGKVLVCADTPSQPH